MVWNMFKVNNKDNRTTPMARKFLLFIRLTKKHFILEWETASQIRMCMYITAWKVSVFGVFLVSIFPLRISPYSVRMRKDTDQKNAKYGHSSRNVSRENVIDLWQRNIIIKQRYFFGESKLLSNKSFICYLVVISQVLIKRNGTFFKI